MRTHPFVALAATLTALLGVAVPAGRAAETPLTIQVHGYMLNRGYLAQGANPELHSERISLSTVATLPNNSTAYVELYYHPWAPASGLYLESAYYDTPVRLGGNLLPEGRLRVGKGRRTTFGITPAYPNRRTTNYGLVSEAFTQDRVQGVQYNAAKGMFDLGLGVYTALRLGVRSLGEVPGDPVHNALHSVPHLSFRDPESGSGVPDSTLSNKLEATGRLGVHVGSAFKAGVSGLVGALDARDLANLTTSSPTNVLTPGATPSLLPAGTSARRRNVLGLDATYQLKSGFVVQGEFYDAMVSKLGYNAWDGLVGWEFASGWRAYARYAEQNMNTPRTANPLTWDTRQVSLSLAQPIAKNIWLQYEYENNNELTNGAAKVRDDLFFVELFSGF